MIMKRITIFSIALVLIANSFSSNLLGQNLALSWGHNYGSPAADVGASMAVDSDGNVYTVGIFSGEIDFDPNPDNEVILSVDSSGANLFVTKHSADGALVFAIQMESESYFSHLYIAVSEDGFIYVAGGFYEEVDFDPSENSQILSSNGFSDIFVLKLNQEGQLLWVNSYGSSDIETAHSLALDADGNVFITGYFRAAIDFNPGPDSYILSPIGGRNTYVLKLNTNGEFLWVAGLLGGISQGFSIALDNLGNSYTVGDFINIVDFNPGKEEFTLQGSGGFAAFIVKLDSMGNFVWAKDFQGSIHNEPVSVDVNADGEILIGGFVSPGTDLDPGEEELYYEHTANLNLFLIKLSENGDLVWSTPIYNQYTSRIYAVSFGPDGAMYAVGYFNGDLDFNPGMSGGLLSTPPNQGGYFIAAFYPNGDFMLANHLGVGSGNRATNDIAIGPDSEILITGYFTQSLNFSSIIGGTTINSVGSSDIFIYSFKHSPTSVYNAKVNEFNVFPNPTTDRVVIASNSFNNSSEVSVVIYNLSGQIVYNQQFIPAEFLEFDPGLSSGFYLLKIVEKGGSQYTTKLVVE
jgi:hypothetical protein